MSRTDKTKPMWVRHYEHAPEPLHDHSAGPCDLPPHPTLEPSGTRCRWEDPEAHFFKNVCCSGCHDRVCTAEWQMMKRERKRKERYAGRDQVRRYLADPQAD